VGPVQIQQKEHRDRLGQTCVLHPVGSVGHVVHYGASEARIVDAIFFLLVWDRYVFQKKRIKTSDTELVFLHLLGYAGHVVRCCKSGCTIFLAQVGPLRIPQKHVSLPYAKLVSLHLVG
jgi:hypothetical protein